jgi:membrane associated rhomboid family serine protease
MQFIFGLAAISTVSSGGGVAYSAHVGGFVTGLLLVRVFAQGTRVDRMRVYHGAYR